MKVQTVTVVGATGAMGTKMAGIFASFGNAKVYLIGRDVEKCRKAIPKILRSVRADSIEARLIPADFSMLETCVQEADLVFDSTAEDFEIKSEIAKKIGKYIGKEALFCTGTSGLSITRLSETFPEELRKNVFGTHFFNPPYNMTLCELIPTKYSDMDKYVELRGYLRKVLLRTVVEVRDTPAFLANRIGFQFINQAMILAQKYRDNGGIDYIDAILGPTTGRMMAPLVTADFVGLDIHKAIVNNLYSNTNDYAHDNFYLPEFAERLIQSGNCGRKSGCGLYKMELNTDGQKHKLVYDISTREYRETKKYSFRFVECMKAAVFEGNYDRAIRLLIEDHTQEAELCVSFLLEYILYALNTADMLGCELSAADAVMATGFNWCPPIALCQAFENQTEIKTLMEERISAKTLAAVDYERLLAKKPQSKYDYRMYLRSV